MKEERERERENQNDMQRGHISKKETTRKKCFRKTGSTLRQNMIPTVLISIDVSFTGMCEKIDRYEQDFEYADSVHFEFFRARKIICSNVTRGRA